MCWTVLNADVLFYMFYHLSILTSHCSLETILIDFLIQLSFKFHLSQFQDVADPIEVFLLHKRVRTANMLCYSSTVNITRYRNFTSALPRFKKNIYGAMHYLLLIKTIIMEDKDISNTSKMYTRGRTSATMVLSSNIPASAPERLTLVCTGTFQFQHQKQGWF